MRNNFQRHQIALTNVEMVHERMQPEILDVCGCGLLNLEEKNKSTMTRKMIYVGTYGKIDYSKYFLLMVAKIKKINQNNEETLEETHVPGNEIKSSCDKSIAFKILFARSRDVAKIKIKAQSSIPGQEKDR